MSASEAWLVTALGIGVVYIGLTLCILFIKLFGALSNKITWTGAHSAPAAAQAPTPAPVAPVAIAPPEAVSPEIQAVIATVLEIEQRLYTGRNHQRLTLRRNDA